MRKIIVILSLLICGLGAFSQSSFVDSLDFKFIQQYPNACFSLPAEFQNTSNDTLNHNLLYIWNFGDGTIDTTISNKKFIQFIYHTFSKDGNFTTTLSAIDTSKGKDSVVASPMAHTYSKVYNPIGGSIDSFVADTFLTYGVTFKASFTPFKPTAWVYNWKFGDGTDTTITGKSVFHKYTQSGNYNVTLTIRLDSNQSLLSDHQEAKCYDTVNHSLTVYDKFFTTDTAANKQTPNIPNIFTPNRDGQNDQFVVTYGDSTLSQTVNKDKVFLFLTSGKETYTFWVYNRWGSLVYKTMGKSIVWNGKSNAGEDLASGVYYYVVESDAPEKSHNTCGFVQLIRD